MSALHAFDARYNTRFHGLRKSLAGMPVDLSGDGFTLARIFEDNVLRLSPPSLDEARDVLWFRPIRPCSKGFSAAGSLLRRFDIKSLTVLHPSSPEEDFTR